MRPSSTMIENHRLGLKRVLRRQLTTLTGALFEALVAEASACRICPAMCERTAVLSKRNGSLGARVMFIGEAPGRQGGDRTRVPFSGDQSGRNFARFLDSIKLTRAAIFITNAVLCNPRKASGANRRPTAQEVSNGSAY